MKPEQELARYFYNATGMKCTTTVFMRQISSAKSLLKVYSLEECKACIDYLTKHQPKNGFSSLAFLQYVMEETKLKINSEAMQRDMEQIKEPEMKTDESNKQKYIENKKLNLKGMMKI